MDLKWLSFLFVWINITGFSYGDKLPNVIIILTDDQGYNDLSCFGSPDIKTPNIDQLAKEGMKLTDYYVASPVCSASRAALLTGQYPLTVGVPGVFFPNRGDDGLDPKHQTIAEALKTVGYATKAVGKWHLGDHKKYLPTNQGFDSYYGIPYSNDMTPAHDMVYAKNCLYREGLSPEVLKEAFAADVKKPKGLKNKVPLMRNEACIEMPVDQTTITKRYTDESLVFISESVKREQPFFLYLAHSMPHIPLYASKDFEGKSERGLYGDVIEEIDYNVGRISKHLKELKIEDNTLIIYHSDNGPWLTAGEHGGSAFPLFEGKFTTFEGGQRVPAIIKWPKQIAAGRICSEIVLSMDILPTLSKITGAKLEHEDLINGADITSILKQEDAKTTHEYFFFVKGAVRSGDWKYHQKETYKVKATARNSKGPSLYNLKNDPSESKNLINDYPEIAERLRLELEKHVAMLLSYE